MKAGEDNLRSLWVMIPTESGFVDIFVHSTEAEFNSLNSVFHKVGTDVELSPSLAYQRRWTDVATITSIIEAAQGIDWSKTISLAIAGMIIALIANFFRRKTRQ
jgi:hypothetical protein